MLFSVSCYDVVAKIITLRRPLSKGGKFRILSNESFDLSMDKGVVEKLSRYFATWVVGGEGGA